jgi:hypothetical protein
MIKTQELKTQLEDLTKQNEMMLLELEHMKQFITGNQKQLQTQKQNLQNMQAQKGNGGQSSEQSGQQQGNRNNPAAQMANDLLQIKDMVAQLEKKTSQYVSSQTHGSLTDKDVVNLVLNLINGMVDWASEFVSANASGSGQQQ